MSAPIESYAILGDTSTCALVGRDGAIDWLCLPRADSEAVFAALLGDERNGRWRLGPVEDVQRVTRRYRPGTLVLETELQTDGGTIRLIDFMPVRGRHGRSDVVRIVEGVEGEVPIECSVLPRFDYGSAQPWTNADNGAVRAGAGPHAIALRTSAEVTVADAGMHAALTVAAGTRVPFVLTAHDSTEPAPAPLAPYDALEATEAWWLAWSGRCRYEGPYGEQVTRSLITLKALIYAPTGGIFAAATTSLPEELGGERNWDHRYCWLRDASLTLMALVRSGYVDEALAFRDWILRTVAGDPAQVQIMYGITGERRLPEMTLPWLSGYAGCTPVRIGNAAAAQFQLDVYGEVGDTALATLEAGWQSDGSALPLVQDMVEFVRDHWREPDEGIWEIRGPRRQFTHSKVMAWVAIDRALRIRDLMGIDRPAPLATKVRDEIHAEVCARGWHPDRQSFVQTYDGDALDASLLLLPGLGFLPPDDPRLASTIRAIEEGLGDGPFVRRYATEHGTDGLEGSAGSFLICAFWLVEALALTGRVDDARRNFEQLLDACNDVGLLAQEYDPGAGIQLGNFPQASSHLGLVSAAHRLAGAA